MKIYKKLTSGHNFMSDIRKDDNTNYDYKDYYGDLMKLYDLKNVDDIKIFNQIQKL
jgi:hypothetical protein